MKAKTRFHLALFCISALFVSGCSTTFTDYTPDRITQNPSGIYTFTFAANIPGSSVVEGSERAQIVINGDTYTMTRSPEDPRIFTYDYRVPAGVSEFRYYYVLTYDFINSNSGKRRTVTRYSTEDEGRIFTARLINRYPIQLVSQRGPVGAAIPLVGSGFTSQDVVVVGGTEAATVVHSANSIEWTVPGLPAGRSYPVVLRTGSGDIDIGQFRIDQSTLRVQPASLNMSSGSAELIIFEIDNPAPAGGLYIEVTTDVPNSVIMPEVIIPEGSRTVSVTVEGGSAGSGTLFVSAPGFGETRVPVSVF